MRVEVERTTEALEEGDCSGLAVREAQAPAAVALPGEDDAEEEADQLAEELRVAREREAELEGEAEHPLAVGDRRQQVVDEVSRGVVGPAGRAARAEPALARVGDEPLKAAGGAAQAGEAPAEQAAVQVVPKFFLDEAGIAGSSMQPRPGEEGLQVLTDDGVEDGLFGLVATVLPRQQCGRGAGMALVVDDREVFWRLAGAGDGGEAPGCSVRRAAAAGRCS